MFEGLYSWSAVTPALVVLGTAVLVLMVDLLVRPGSRLIPWLAGAGLLAGFLVSLAMQGTRETAFSGAWRLDPYALFFYALFCAAGAVTVVLSGAHEERQGRFPGEYYALLLFSVVGMMAMASAEDLITLILGLETMSLPAYVLVGLNRPDRRTSEGAVKYFLLGAFASAFLLYGTALIYGAAGATDFETLGSYLTAAGGSPGPLFGAGAVMLLVGLGFKVAAVPFHMWAPDAYQAAPTPITAFMATAIKAAGFAAMVRIFGLLFAYPAAGYHDLVYALAVLSMIVGNFGALMQANLKRMLAYSSVAHVGYLLVALVASRPLVSTQAGTSVLFYLTGYALMTLGAFAVMVMVQGGADRRETLPDWAGLSSRSPGLALAMALFMISLSGIPGTVGFFGKFYAFGAAVQTGYIGLAVLGVLTSVVGVYYYLRVVVYMYMRPAEKSYEVYPRPLAGRLTAGILAVAVLYAGIFPQSLLQAARTAFLSLF
ncbi:MAG: NADH-quinone oxidoreductase subunit N [bacterium]